MWSIKTRSTPVLEYVTLDDCEMPSASEFERLLKRTAQHRRYEYEPSTHDIDPDDQPGLYKRAESIVKQANKRFCFSLDGWQQPLRINRYEEGHEFRWHNDYTLGDNSKLALIYMIKPSAVGGHLQLMAQGQAIQLPLKAGEAVVFPAYLQHRVTRIEEGERIVLAGWATGKRFV